MGNGSVGSDGQPRSRSVSAQVDRDAGAAVDFASRLVGGEYDRISPKAIPSTTILRSEARYALTNVTSEPRVVARVAQRTMDDLVSQRYRERNPDIYGDPGRRSTISAVIGAEALTRLADMMEGPQRGGRTTSFDILAPNLTTGRGTVPLPRGDARTAFRDAHRSNHSLTVSQVPLRGAARVEAIRRIRGVADGLWSYVMESPAGRYGNEGQRRGLP